MAILQYEKYNYFHTAISLLPKKDNAICGTSQKY